MTFEKLLKNYSFDDLMSVIVDMFPGTNKYRFPLEKAYEILTNMRSVPSKKSIRYKIMDDPNSSATLVGAEDSNFNTTWEVCLGKEVMRERGVDLSDIELTANSLVNVCFIAKHPKSFEEYYQLLIKK